MRRQGTIRRLRTNRGFTLVELLVTLALTLLVGSAVAALARQAVGGAEVQPARVDATERARAGLQTLLSDLDAAGGGFTDDLDAGVLIGLLPPVMPWRLSASPAPPAAAVRPDAVSIVTLDETGHQTRVAAPFSPGGDLRLDVARPRCRIPEPACGLDVSDPVLVADRSGRFSLFETLAVAPAAATLRPLTAFSAPFSSSDLAGVARIRIYYFDSATRQLRMSDGYRSDTPVVDDVVDVSFEYFGDPGVVARPKPALGTANCLYDALGNLQPTSPVAATGASVAPLPLSIFRDGPWCGDTGVVYDADVLRIRHVSVRVRTQVASQSLRGVGPDFLQSGTSSSALRMVPDVSMRSDVSPANLQVTR